MDQQRQIFPHEIVEYSVEKHFKDYDTGTKRLYLTILAVILLFFVAMFLIKVDVVVTSAGSISPIQGRTTIRTPIAGIIDSVYITENMHVKAGQPMMSVHAQSLDQKGVGNQSQREELQAQAEDLQKILNIDLGKGDAKNLPLQSALYRQQYNFYKEKLANVHNKYDLVNKAYQRYAELYQNHVVSAAEYEAYEFQLKNVESERNLVISQQLNQWQQDLTNLNTQLQVVNSVIKAPVEGFVQQLKGMQPGSIISPSDELGQITPDTGMIAEAYVLPKDVGLVRPGTTTRIQVDAYNYNIWGMLKADVISISHDIFTDAGQPYFKVRCRLHGQSLQLKNGYKGYVKNGMTLQAHFMLARRTLFQLLYDKADNWLNPSQEIKNDQKKLANNG